MAHSVSQSEGTIIVFDEELTLASLVEASLVIYQNTNTYPLFVDVLRASGQAEGLYRILHNSNTFYKERTSGSNLNLYFDIPNGLLLKPGDTIEIKVTNCHDSTADFSGAILMHRTC